MIADPGAFAALFVVLYAAHLAGDYLLQTDELATTKDQPGWPGRLACAQHVGVQVLAASIAMAVLELALAGPAVAGLGGAAVGLAVIAVTHYFADRRAPLRALVSWWRGGRGMDWVDGGGLAHVDQAWHVVWLVVAAAVMAA